MPTVNDMFPSLDYDSLNKGLGFVNFNVDPTQSLNLDLNNSLPQQGVNESKDGVIPSTENYSPSNVEVSETDISVNNNNNWESLTKAERIELVKQQASGMPLTSRLDLKLLVKTSSYFQKQGMFKEAGKLIQLASDFEKSITLFTRETENEGTSQSTVSVQEDGEVLTQTFKDPSEAKAFYDSLAPKMEQVKELANTLQEYNMIEEASNLNEFIKQYSIFNSEIPLLLRGSTVWHKDFGIGKVAWIDGNIVDVVFKNNPVWVSAANAKGRIVYLEKGITPDFYRLLSSPVIIIVEKKDEYNDKGEPKKIRIPYGKVKALDNSGTIHVINEFPLVGADEPFLSTTKMKEDSLQLHEDSKSIPKEELY